MYKINNSNFKEGIVWWDTKPDSNADVDVFFYIHDYEGRAEYKYGFRTLEWKLQEMSNDDIMMGYKSELRNRIKKALAMPYEVKREMLKKEDIDEYINTFNSFADFKKIQRTQKEMIEQLVEDGKIHVSRIFYEGELITCHSHYVADGIARLYHSFSTNNSQDSNVNSLSNKLLTHFDLIGFKEDLIKTYDMGGIGNVEGDNSRFEGIIKFKKKFGGTEKIIWKGVSPNGERGIPIIEKYFNLK